ncbi:MAG: glycosyltransferase family 4 protein [Flavobacterium sp.]|nr:glycosyltransferase family 4 protein [Flavobacterium sp.]
MHIGLLTSEYPYEGSPRSGGIGTSIKNLAVELVKCGVRVSVFAHSQDKDEVRTEEDVEIHLIKSRKYSIFTFYKYRKYVQKYVNQQIHRSEIDVVEAPDWTGFTAFMKFDAPLVIRFHGSDAYFCKLENRRQKIKNFIFEWLALQGADAFVSPTNYAGKVTSEIFNLQKEFTRIHYGISLSKFENQQPENFENGLILYIGTVIRKKGVLELPSIMKKVSARFPRAKLVLIGADSPDISTGSSSTWKMIEAEFDGNAKYLGKVPYVEVQQYLRNAHVCVFPTFAETLGMVTIEAMAMQKPVVNSNYGWAQEIITDGESGFLVDPADHDLFSERIFSLLSDPERCKTIGKNARERVDERFNIEKTVYQNIELYKSLSKS